jgi:hypothetical protein
MKLYSLVVEKNHVYFLNFDAYSKFAFHHEDREEIENIAVLIEGTNKIYQWFDHHNQRHTYTYEGLNHRHLWMNLLETAGYVIVTE